jgi:hypothetical protein
MTRLGYRYDDGGRKAAGFKGITGDCVTRAIAIATRTKYSAVYEKLNWLCEYPPRTYRKGQYAHSGISLGLWKAYLWSRGWRYFDCDPRPFYLRRHKHRPRKFSVEDLPNGTLILHLCVDDDWDGPRHVCVVKDHVVLDNYPTHKRDVKVLGFFRKKRRRMKRAV